jgi:TonB family protein
MSKTRLISAFAMSLVMLAAACWYVTGAFPLAAAPQMVSDGMGVSVEMSGAGLMHRSAVNYPPAALNSHIEGTVVVQVKLGAKGEVVDATVMSGPDELRKSVISSVLDWHFMRDAANSTRQVSVTFQLPKVAAASSSVTVEAQAGSVQDGVVRGVPGGKKGEIRTGVLGGMVGSGPIGGIIGAAPSAAPANAGTVKSIVVRGLSDQARNELLAQLPIHEGDTLTGEAFSKLIQTVKDYDEHLSTGMMRDNATGDLTVQISAPGATWQMMSNASAPTFPVPPGAIRVGGNVQQVKLTSQPAPVYPPLAKQAHISGVVHLYALIGKDGAVTNLQVISGHPLLVQSAMEAVRQWTYQPTLLNGQPVEVVTQIDVNFTLSQ